MIRRLSLLFLSLTLFHFSGFAQDQSTTKPLSVEDCIRIALKNNSQLKIASRQLDLSDKNHRQAYSNILPTVDMFFQLDKFKRGPSSYIGGEFVGKGALPSSDGNNYTAQLSISENLLDGGFWWNNIRKANSDRKAQQMSFFDRFQKTIVTVKQNYFTLLREMKLLEVYDQAVKRSQEQVERSQSLYEVGSVAKVDVFKSKVNLGNDQIQYLNQKNVVEKARRDLNLAMGRNPLEPLEIETEVHVDKRLPKLDSLISLAIKNNPGLKQVKQQEKSAQLQTKLATSQYWPRISGFFNYSRRAPQFRALYTDLGNEFTWTAGVRLNWNLFRGFSDFINRQKAQINERISQENYVEFQRNLISTIKNLYDNLQALNQIIEINKTNLESAQEEYRLAQERYRVGSGTSLELREAQVNLTRAEQVVVSAEFNSMITHSQLQETIGLYLNKY